MDNRAEYVDTQEAMQRFRGNVSIYRKMLQIFLQQPEFAALEKKLGEQDWTGAAEVAHAIKGMVGNLSLPALFKESTTLMNQLRQGQPDETTLASYRAALQATTKAVEELLTLSDEAF